MAEREQSVARIAAAILDGTPIDWPAAESSAQGEDRRLLEELRVLWSVADLHRTPRDQAEGGEPLYWGRLRLIQRVGRGTFGEVYRAWDPRLEREVALKLIPSSTGPDGLASAAILREGRLLARVRHPSVVAIYDAEQKDGWIGLCMEFVQGETLAERVDKRGVFPPAETAAIGLQLCEALEAVHAAGVLHRDIKASNVVVCDDGRVMLADFGAGHLRDDGRVPGVTGTPLYLAPEVLAGDDATTRSDIYALGVLLHYMVTGRYPVEGDSLPDLRQAHARRAGGERATPGSHAAAGRLTPIIDKAIDPEPSRRYDSARALARDLRAFQGARRALGWVLTTAAVLLAALAGAFVLNGRAPRGANPPPEPLRIAVLPFTVSEGGADADVLRDGVTRDLIARLQGFDGVRVISTATAMSINPSDVSLPQLAERLDLGAIVTGAIHQIGASRVLEARLVQFPGQRTLWSAEFRGDLSQMLDLQGALATAIAGELRLRSLRGEHGWPTRNPEAYALYVRGQTALDRFTPDGTRLALRLFEQALELDPGFAQAHAGLTQIYLADNPAVPNLSGDEMLQRASAHAALAMSYDGLLPEAHVADAGVKSAHYDWNGADAAFRRAIALGPSNVRARQQYAHWLSLLGRFDEAIEQARVAESLDTLSPRSVIGVASALRFARRYEEAIVQAHKVLELDPGHLTAYLNLGHNYLGLGRVQEAIEAFEKTGRPSGNLGNAYALAGRIDDARALIAQFERLFADTGRGAGEIAQIYCGLGEIDRAFEWLERAQGGRAGGPSTYKVAPVWDPLRADPRFTVLLRRFGLQ